MDPVVLIPGTLCDDRVWEHQLEHLAKQTKVYVADITQDSSVTSMASRVLEDAPETFALAGISQGAIVAMEVIRKAPHRVKRLALLDTSAGAAGPQQIEVWENQKEMVENGRFLEVIRDQFIPKLLYNKQDSESTLNSLKEMTERVGEEGFINQLKANMTRPDAKASLPKIQCSVLVLGGREDALSSEEKHKEMAELIPHSSLVFIENCGHLSTVDQPEAVTAVLMYWLQKEEKYAGK